MGISRGVIGEPPEFFTALFQPAGLKDMIAIGNCTLFLIYKCKNLKCKLQKKILGAFRGTGFLSFWHLYHIKQSNWLLFTYTLLKKLKAT